MSPVVGSPPWTSEEDERLRALTISGKPVAEIAKHVGQAVRNRLHKLGRRAAWATGKNYQRE